MKKRCVLTILLLVIFTSFTVFAHPGRTDEDGGHHDYDNESGLGSYHYHHGYPAHLHENGICPYNYDDQTGINDNEDSSNSTTKKYYAGTKSNKWAPDSEQTVYLEDDIFHLKGCPGIQGNGTLRSLSFLTKEVQPCNYCQPLKYNSIEDVPGYEDPTEESIGLIEIIGIGALLLWVIWIGYILLSCFSFLKDKIQNKLKSKNTEQMLKLKEAERIQAEYEYYFSCYAFYPPESFVDIPKGVFLKHGLPATSGRGKYGLYTVYVTPKGKCYHQRELCLKSPNLKQTHFIFINGYLRPCSRCVKKVLPDLNWYYEYKRIYDIKKKYLIP